MPELRIKVRCPLCPNVANLPESAKGKKVKCGKCQQAFEVKYYDYLPIQLRCPFCPNAGLALAETVGKRVKCLECGKTFDAEYWQPLIDASQDVLVLAFDLDSAPTSSGASPAPLANTNRCPSCGGALPPKFIGRCTYCGNPVSTEPLEQLPKGVVTSASQLRNKQASNPKMSRKPDYGVAQSALHVLSQNFGRCNRDIVSLQKTAQAGRRISPEVVEEMVRPLLLPLQTYLEELSAAGCKADWSIPDIRSPLYTDQEGMVADGGLMNYMQDLRAILENATRYTDLEYIRIKAQLAPSEYKTVTNDRSSAILVAFGAFLLGLLVMTFFTIKLVDYIGTPVAIVLHVACSIGVAWVQYSTEMDKRQCIHCGAKWSRFPLTVSTAAGQQYLVSEEKNDTLRNADGRIVGSVTGTQLGVRQDVTTIVGYRCLVCGGEWSASETQTVAS